MTSEFSERSLRLQEELRRFMADVVIPNEGTYDEQLRAVGPHSQPPVMEEMKAEARNRGLWNLFLTHGDRGAGLTNHDYAPLAEEASRSFLGLEAINCAAPDTGNMELLTLFGTPEQQERWLDPLLAGEIRSSFALTEPAVASSDPRNIRSTVVRDGDHYVLNGHKWFASGLVNPRCRVVLFVGVSDPAAPTYQQQSVVLVPVDTPGLEIVRDLTVFGYTDPLGHGEVTFTDVRVPASHLLGEEGGGFRMAQERLGPGRMHYAMRAVGMAERALELMCWRATRRHTFGQRLSDQGVVREWVARSRIEIDQARSLTLHAARLMDTRGNQAARREVAEIKVAVLAAASQVVDRALQVFGAAGVSDDFPLARMYTSLRALRIGDGPDEVHLRTLARMELAPYEQAVSG